MHGLEEGSFRERLGGRFDGMIRVEGLAPLCAEVARHESWHLLAPSGDEEDRQISGSEACGQLQHMVEEILKEERGVWTTMVYAQSLEDPWIIKVFHPRRAGCGCGDSGGGITPWRVFSRVTPEPVPEWNPEGCEIPEAKGSWVSKLFS
ncbi:MAG: hypothetical protein HQL53_03415 [Magnetococcales bacterium]|nr:hypothetical protein [Magnetococcales bacterium]